MSRVEQSGARILAARMSGGGGAFQLLATEKTPRHQKAIPCHTIAPVYFSFTCVLRHARIGAFRRALRAF